ncbi:NADPH-dependent FMN reductase [Marinicella sp. W31]|uniref:NADPH-dependent FMN reductase n=1 Tax=Marinicella sp. W31 TaxID=3023713 RepID=UPI0037567844
MKIAAISGSLRKNSTNTGILHALVQNLPAPIEVDVIPIDGVPLYNQDVNEQGIPDAVLEIDKRIRRADAVVLASPEYNYSITGVLKNTLDWLSRVPEQAFDQKPVAIVGASPGGIGTARAQYHLRQVLVFLNARVLNKPEVMISHSGQKFDKEGHLTDQKTIDFLQTMAQSLKKMVDN